MATKATNNSLNWMYLMVAEPYYLIHLLIFFSYIPIRCSAAHVLSPVRSSHLFHREIQAVLAFLVFTSIKVVKTESWEAFIADILLLAKIFLGAIALIMDYHLALWYALAFSVVYLIAQQPAYDGLGTLTQLTPLQLETLLTEGNTSKFWLVEFTSMSTSKCLRTSSFFPELSITFSNKNLSFGTVDLGLFPNAAEKFGISLASLNQLPVYMLFRDGAVISRLPVVDFEAKIFDSPLSKKLLCRHFELDKLLLDYINGLEMIRVLKGLRSKDGSIQLLFYALYHFRTFYSSKLNRSCWHNCCLFVLGLIKIFNSLLFLAEGLGFCYVPGVLSPKNSTIIFSIINIFQQLVYWALVSII